MKAAARGTPAKLEATPEKVVLVDRNGRGKPPIETAHAIKNPNKPPRRAVMRLSRIDIT
jgi:hypothetical protein